MTLFVRIYQGFAAAISSFRSARAGTLPVIFALSIIPVMGLVGLAADFAGARSAKVRLQAIADSAALEAVTQAERIETEGGNESDFVKNDQSYVPIKRAADLFNALANEGSGIEQVAATFRVERKGDTLTALVTYSAQYKSSMPGIMSASLVPIDGNSQSTIAISGTGFMDVYTLLDTSSSMGIGASKVDIDNLKKYLGCAFSCHGEKPTEVTVQLRIDVMRDSVLDMIATAKAEKNKQKKGDPARIRIALNKFDHATSEIQSLTSNYTKLKNAAEDIALHPNEHRGTNAKAALDWLAPKVPATGTGLTKDSPRRFVFLVTDGLQDRHPNWYPINFPGPFGAGDRIGPIDPASCDAFKAKGVTVAVLYTTHVGIPGYEWYWQTPQPQVRPNLLACASPGYFYEGSDAAQLSNEFKKMFKKALDSSKARLEK
ncbi:vWFA domain containing protein [Rhabdaerophilaceae bacterium]